MSSTNRIRVMLVDDHPIVRMGLRDVLEDSGAFDVVGQAADGEEAVGTAEESRPDVIVMDVMMPKKNGVEACREIVDLLPGTKVLMLTASSEDDAVIEAVAAGATGFVQKYSGSDELVDAIRQVAEGRLMISDDAVRRVFKLIRGGTYLVSGLNVLTSREQEVLTQFATGKVVCSDCRSPGRQHGDGQERHLSGTGQAGARVQAGDRGVGRAKRSAGWGVGTGLVRWIERCCVMTRLPLPFALALALSVALSCGPATPAQPVSGKRRHG